MRRARLSFKFNQLRRRFGISAPSVVVRPGVPQRWQLAASAFTLLLLLWVAYSSWRQFGVGADVVALQATVSRQAAEMDALRAKVSVDRSLDLMDRAAVDALQTRILQLERENHGLREDVLLFERLMAAPGVAGELVVPMFRAAAEGGRLRYRLFAVYQADRQRPDWRGAWRLRVEYESKGRLAYLVVPDAAPESLAAKVEIRHFFHQEGDVALPEGARVRRAELTFWQSGQIKLQRVLEL